MKEFKSMKQKWEELLPHIDQMKIWANHKNVADGGRPANEKLIMSKEKKAILHKVLKVAYEQLCIIDEGELKLLEDFCECLCCGRDLNTVTDKHCESLSEGFEYPKDDETLSTGDFILYFNYKGIEIKEGAMTICPKCSISHWESCLEFKKDGQDLKLKDKR